jgi:uncharacterized delta-60 repeat protein
VTNFGGTDVAYGVSVIQSDNTIVVAGTSGGNFVVARYRTNGSVMWKKVTNFGGTDIARAVSTFGNDNTIAVAGTSGGNFAVARYGEHGALLWKKVTNFGGTDVAYGVSVNWESFPGGIVVAGTSGGNFALARYTSNGALDDSFSGDGKQVTDFGGSDVAYGVAHISNMPVVGGTAHGNFAVARYRGQ